MIKIEKKNVYLVMYHYVRPYRKNKYFPALALNNFKNQINYFQKVGRIIDNDEFVYILKNNKFNKEPNFLLTFDDGYKDHYEFVYPYLKKFNLTGNFYVPTSIWKNNRMLDINKIHLILQKKNDHNKLLDHVYKLLSKKLEKKFKSKAILQHVVKNKYDKIETLIIKRFLQYMLPSRIRTKILNKLFNEIINISNSELINKTYLSVANAQEMSCNGMHFGSHGESHKNFRLLNYKDQFKEIKNSLSYMKKNEINNYETSLCYPWGEYNNYSKILFEKFPIQYGITVNPGSINNLSNYSKFYLPRYDTNYFN